MSPTDIQSATLDPDTTCARTRPRRILFANSWSSCHGGSSTSLIDIVTHLDRSRFDPLVVCPEPGELPRRLGEAGISVVVHRNTPVSKTSLLPFARDAGFFWRLLGKHRISLVHSNVGGARSAIVMAAWLKGIPYIQHVRNPISTIRRSTIGYHLAARILTNSDDVAKPLKDDDRFRDRTATIYNSVDLSRYENSDNRHDDLAGKQGPVVGFVGQLIPRKGVTTLIKAISLVARRFPDICCVVVGCSPSGEHEYENQCHCLVKQLNLESHVQFAGYQTDVPAWMNSFDVFVLPARSEPFGKVVVEAMAACCPVVASAIGGIPEIISRPELGTLISPDDPQATADAILRYLTHSELAEQTGKAAATHVRTHFSLDSMVRRLEQVYTDVLTESGRG